MATRESYNVLSDPSYILSNFTFLFFFTGNHLIFSYLVCFFFILSLWYVILHSSIFSFFFFFFLFCFFCLFCFFFFCHLDEVLILTSFYLCSVMSAFGSSSLSSFYCFILSSRTLRSFNSFVLQSCLRFLCAFPSPPGCCIVRFFFCFRFLLSQPCIFTSSLVVDFLTACGPPAVGFFSVLRMRAFLLR